MSNAAALPRGTRPGEDWHLRQPFTWKHVLITLIVFVLLGYSAHRTEIDRGAWMTAEGVADAAGLVEEAEVSAGFQRFFRNAFPLVLSTETEVSRLSDFDADNLPWLAYTVEKPRYTYDVETMESVKTGEVTYLVRPMGYLWYVVGLMFKTIEIALWGTIVSVIMAAPIAYLGARQYAPHRSVYVASRALCSFARAVPELVTAMFLVLMYGFGPVPGVLALAIHSAGFLGKFFADDVENADPGPQEALWSTGCGRLRVLWYAVMPQVLPQYLAYVNYILERNVRTATVIGIVGAGGIGVELWGRWDMSNFQHVSTILLVIFITVFLLEHACQAVRKRLIA